MTSLLTCLAAAAALLIAPPCAASGTAPIVVAQSTAPDPAQRRKNCSKAIEEAVAHLRRVPTSGPNDKARKDALEAKTLALIAANRGKGVDECTTWSQVMGLAFSQ